MRMQNWKIILRILVLKLITHLSVFNIHWLKFSCKSCLVIMCEYFLEFLICKCLQNIKRNVQRVNSSRGIVNFFAELHSRSVSVVRFQNSSSIIVRESYVYKICFLISRSDSAWSSCKNITTKYGTRCNIDLAKPKSGAHGPDCSKPD